MRQYANLLTEDESAKVLGLSPHTLKRWRVVGKGPRYIKVGAVVRYRREDLDSFIEAGAVDPQEKAEDNE